MNKTYRSVLLWGAAALVCLIVLARPSYAANISELPDFRPGPGDYYDVSGRLYSLDGKLLVEADGEIVDTELALEIKNRAALAAANGLGTTVSAAEVEEAAAQAQTAEAQEAVQAQEASVVTDTPAEVAADTEEAAGAAAAEAAQPAYQVSDEDGRTVYSYEGKKYVAASSYGVHKLSGYCPTPEYGRGTFSGKEARSCHTIAVASDLPIGTMVILKGTSGPYPSDYNGVYCVEDRGGYYIEQEGWIDIFFDTDREAAHVTDAGWNYAEVWVAKEVD